MPYRGSKIDRTHYTERCPYCDLEFLPFNFLAIQGHTAQCQLKVLMEILKTLKKGA